jgi:prevent-host-death family protein
MVTMETATVARLKSELSRYLRRVKAGDEVVVTERGVPIARLVPIRRGPADLESLRDLERQGLIRLGRGQLPRGFWKLPRGRDPKAAVLKALLEERDSGL